MKVHWNWLKRIPGVSRFVRKAEHELEIQKEAERELEELRVQNFQLGLYCTAEEEPSHE